MASSQLSETIIILLNDGVRNLDLYFFHLIFPQNIIAILYGFFCQIQMNKL